MAQPRKGCSTACNIFVAVVVMSLSLHSSESFYPHTVKNHVVVNQDLLIKRFLAQDWINCIMSCQNDPKCLSYNYEYEKKENGWCELYECGVNQEKELTKDLVYSYGFLFQQLKHHHKGMKQCKGCRQGWTRYGFHCYKVIDDKKSWENASRYCRKIGGNLTSIHSQAENEFITDTVLGRLGTSSTPYYFWIGARIATDDSIPCANFTFQDQSVTSYNNLSSSGQCKCEANNDCRCVNVKWSSNKRGVWLYHTCTSEKPFVCKY